jgi:hypothetical protein
MGSSGRGNQTERRRKWYSPWMWRRSDRLIDTLSVLLLELRLSLREKKYFTAGISGGFRHLHQKIRTSKLYRRTQRIVATMARPLSLFEKAIICRKDLTAPLDAFKIDEAERQDRQDSKLPSRNRLAIPKRRKSALNHQRVRSSG